MRTLRLPVMGLLVLGILGWASLMAPQQATAQLLVVNEKVYVTEIRPEVNKIGIASGPSTKTRNWIKIEGGTRVSHGGRTLAPREIYRTLRPGMVLRVHGGRDWDQNIVAKKIWF